MHDICMYVSVHALLNSFYGNGSSYISLELKSLIIQLELRSLIIQLELRSLIIQLAHLIVLAAPACWMYTGRGANMSESGKRNFMIESGFVLETSTVFYSSHFAILHNVKYM